jgi:hypothetical protein
MTRSGSDAGAPSSDDQAQAPVVAHAAMCSRQRTMNCSAGDAAERAATSAWEIDVMRSCYTFVFAIVLAMHAHAQCPQQPQRAMVRISHVTLAVASDVEMKVVRLRGELTPPKIDAPLRQEAINVRIDAAEVHLADKSLNALINNYVFDEPDAPMKVSVTVHDGRVRVNPRKWWAPSFNTSLSVRKGEILLDPRLLPGRIVASFVNWPNGRVHGVWGEGSEIHMDPDNMMKKLLRMDSAVTSIRAMNGYLIETFGPDEAASKDIVLRIDGGDIEIDGFRTSQQPIEIVPANSAAGLRVDLEKIDHCARVSACLVQCRM